MTNADIVILQAKAALLDAFVIESRLYRGYLQQHADTEEQSYSTNRMFAPLYAYDELFGEQNVENGQGSALQSDI